MNRRRFIKKMMAFGFSRNAMNNVTNEILKERDRRRAKGSEVYVTWKYMYGDAYLQITYCDMDIRTVNNRWEHGNFSGKA